MKIINKFFAILIALILVSNSMLPVFATQTNNDAENNQEVEKEKHYFHINKDAKPQFIVEGDAIYGPFNSNGMQTLKVKLKNNSTHQARDIYASIAPSDSKDEIFLPQGAKLDDKKNTSIFGNGNVEFQFSFLLNPRTVSKPYKLNLKVRYKNFLGTEFENNIPIFINIQNNFVTPSISVVDYEINGGVVSSQEPTDIKIKLKNNSTEMMKNVTTQILDMSADGIELHNDSEYKFVGDMASSTDIFVRYTLKASPAANDNKSLKLKISYYDKQGIAYEKEWPLYIPVTGAGNITKNVKLTFSKDTYNIKAGESSDIKIIAKNTSDSDIKNIKLDINIDGGLKFLTPYKIIIDNLPTNQEKSFVFKIHAPKSTEKGTYPITALVSSVNSSNSSIADISGVVVDRDAGSSSNSKPKIIIDKYDYGSDYIKAGSEFDVNVSFLNTSSNLSINNVKVQMESEEGVFVPVNATNSFFFKEIKPLQNATKTIRFKSKADAKVKLYTLTFKLEYEDETGKAYDEKGNLFTSTEIVTVNVKQDVRLEINQVKLPESLNVGNKSSLEVEYFNMGKAPLYNLIVKLEGDFDKTDTSSYVGNFESSKSEYFSTTITPTKEGVTKGKLIFEFEDETGEKLKKEKEFEFNAIQNTNEFAGLNDQTVENNNPNVPNESQNPSEAGGFNIISFILSPIVLAVLALIAIVVTIIVLKRKKAKRLQELMEEEDED